MEEIKFTLIIFVIVMVELLIGFAGGYYYRVYEEKKKAKLKAELLDEMRKDQTDKPS